VSFEFVALHQKCPAPVATPVLQIRSPSDDPSSACGLHLTSSFSASPSDPGTPDWGNEAPCLQGARRANTVPYLTDEQRCARRRECREHRRCRSGRSRQGCIVVPISLELLIWGARIDPGASAETSAIPFPPLLPRLGTTPTALGAGLLPFTLQPLCKHLPYFAAVAPRDPEPLGFQGHSVPRVDTSTQHSIYPEACEPLRKLRLLARFPYPGFGRFGQPRTGLHLCYAKDARQTKPRHHSPAIHRHRHTPRASSSTRRIHGKRYFKYCANFEWMGNSAGNAAFSGCFVVWRGTGRWGPEPHSVAPATPCERCN
jgi:hypothetical protein